MLQFCSGNGDGSRFRRKVLALRNKAFHKIVQRLTRLC